MNRITIVGAILVIARAAAAPPLPSWERGLGGEGNRGSVAYR
jgi:hypothetical protein